MSARTLRFAVIVQSTRRGTFPIFSENEAGAFFVLSGAEFSAADVPCN